MNPPLHFCALSRICPNAALESAGWLQTSFLLPLLISLPICSNAQTASLIVPGEYANASGQGAGSGITAFPRTYQVIYSGIAFSAAAGDQLQISGIAFRLDERLDESASLDVVVPRIEVWAG